MAAVTHGPGVLVKKPQNDTCSILGESQSTGSVSGGFASPSDLLPDDEEATDAEAHVCSRRLSTALSAPRRFLLLWVRGQDGQLETRSQKDSFIPQHIWQR